LGIFLILFSWEATSNMICFQRLSMGAASTNSIAGLGAFLMYNIFFAHLYGFFLAFFVARWMLNYLGERKSLIAIPIATGLLVVAYFTTKNPALMLVYYPMIRAINISMSYSIREALYIPTSRYIRYKSKSWIDTFGSKGARSVGALATFLTERVGGGAHSIYMMICVTIAVFWTMTANYLGKKYEHAVKNNEIIS
jgi:ATP:ADP antiporter, AAA family